MVERSGDLHIFTKQKVKGMHRSIYRCVHDSWLSLLCILPPLPSKWAVYLIKKRVLVSRVPMFGHNKAVWRWISKAIAMKNPIADPEQDYYCCGQRRWCSHSSSLRYMLPSNRIWGECTIGKSWGLLNFGFIRIFIQIPTGPLKNRSKNGTMIFRSLIIIKSEPYYY